MSSPAEGTSSSKDKGNVLSNAASSRMMEDSKGAEINNIRGTTIGVCRALLPEKHLGNPGAGEHKAGLKFIL